MPQHASIRPVSWVTINEFSELNGYTEDAVRAKIKTGVWLRDRHFRKSPDNRIVISLSEYEKWVEGKVA